MKKTLFSLLISGLMLFTTACSSTPASTNTSSTAGGSTPVATVDESWSKVETAGKLIIGLDDSFAPMGFRDSANDLVGFDIDLANAVCEILGVEAVFQPIAWDAKEMELSTGNIDCIWNGLSITPERQASMSMTRGYLDNKIIIMTTQDVTITEKEQLADYTITTQSKSAALEVIMADPLFDSISANLTEYQSYSDCVLDIKSGRAQVMVIDAVAGEYMNTQLGNIFKISEANFGEDLYGVGFRKDDLALTEKLQAAIDETIKSGTAADISTKWFGRDLMIQP